MLALYYSTLLNVICANCTELDAQLLDLALGESERR